MNNNTMFIILKKKKYYVHKKHYECNGIILFANFVAAVCRKPGEPLIIEEIFVAPPMPREARIRIICTSLCHSDIICFLFDSFLFNICLFVLLTILN
jgi:hypothetical protein